MSDDLTAAVAALVPCFLSPACKKGRHSVLCSAYRTGYQEGLATLQATITLRETRYATGGNPAPAIETEAAARAVDEALSVLDEARLVSQWADAVDFMPDELRGELHDLGEHAAALVAHLRGPQNIKEETA